MERIDTFTYDDGTQQVELSFCYEISPHDEDWRVYVYWVNDENDVVMIDPPQALLAQAVEAAKAWAVDHFDIDDYYTALKWESYERY